MAQEQATQLLQQGIAAARGNRPDIAREKLQQAVRLDPRNETIWLWLSSVARDDKERLFCLKQLLAINPQNEFALKGLQALGVTAAAESPAEASSTTVPVLDDDRYTRMQQAVDDFLRRYSPQPPDRLDIQWVHKEKRRYGEGGAQRLRRITYAAAGLTAVVVIGIVALILSQLDIGLGSGLQVAQSTRFMTRTPTPTLTPTQGGPTPTPFPAAMSVPATDVPTGLTQGNPYAAAEPTDIYPAVNRNVAGSIDKAIDYYSVGDYTSAVGTLEAQRGFSGDNCYSAIVYYEAMSYAAQGGTQNLNRAVQSINDALAYAPPRGFATCQDDPLLLAGLAEVRYLQNDLTEALTLSERALADDPKLVQAILVKAKVELSNADFVSARFTVAQALAETPGDVNLLLLGAEIELADNQLSSALAFLGRALYVEPANQPALQRQAQVYTLLAERSEPGSDQQIQYYGLAVVSAQTLLLYYPGDPVGYLYLGKARIGEGNYDMADTALTRIIELENRLPPSAETTIQEAYRVRGMMYYVQGRLDQAQNDLNEASLDNMEDFSSLERLVDIAFRTGEYVEAQNWLDQLLASDPANPTYLLWQARLLVETCTFYPDDLTCEYGDMLDLLNDGFVFGLGSDQQAEAYSYRAQARYFETLRLSSLTDTDRQAAFQVALDDVNRALAVRDAAIDHYYRGLLLEGLGRLNEALGEYQWVIYWSQWYSYPFKNNQFDDRVERLTETILAQATPVPTATATSAVRPATSTPTPTLTPTLAPTFTPLATVAPDMTVSPTAVQLP